MQTQKRYATLILESLLDRPQSQGQLQQKLQGKLNLLEANYAKMEGQYFRRIKELKAHLNERGRKQAILSTEAGLLREEWKEHQQDILRLTEELAAEKEREEVSKQQKKNNSPGLLKTSLESGKRVEKKMSPSMRPSHANAANDRSQQYMKEADASTLALAKKGYSPPNLTKKTGLFQYKIQEPFQPQKKQTTKLNSNPKTYPSPRLSTKSSSDLKGFLLNSLKSFDKEKPSLPNNSPKRILRRSPVNPSQKPQKRLLCNLKEQIMQAF